MSKLLRAAVAACACAALASALALAGCSGSSDESTGGSNVSGSLQVFAANSLEKALPEVQALYTQKTGVTFDDTQFKGSGDLVSQLQAGASADVLITASTSTMDDAVACGSVVEESVIDMFVNDLVMCAKTDSGITMNSLDDLATDAISSFAMGDPATVPAGKYAAQALEFMGFCTLGDDNVITWINQAVGDKANAGADKAGTVASYVAQGQCDVGFVYSSDIFRYDGIGAIYTVPSDEYKSIKYPGAVTTDAANPDAAADFIGFCMNDPDALAIFSQYGFEIAAQ